MSAEIAQQTSAQAELEAGGGGIFDVYAGDKLLFSKHQQGRFPEPGEIAALLDN